MFYEGVETVSRINKLRIFFGDLTVDSSFTAALQASGETMGHGDDAPQLRASLNLSVERSIALFEPGMG